MDYDAMKKEAGRIIMKPSIGIKAVIKFMAILQEGLYNPKISWDKEDRPIIKIFLIPNMEDLKFILKHKDVEDYEEYTAV